ncbi:leucine-zipper of insertion element IS481 [Streptoalloteichus tenebrarius]|uniref:Leucine-zipper of insertion element IS481 n=1 Tax=Streptoalloteichus tenebrarius (strain ATCC 17920 / DSM 40477 / JCM 4838 / CBS 697.72 / NBRC 16177 / NCIMB 11028 / NRRL B-12390 / A12253. 1 / ISP 5477) TaxID=1933 RepID=A0ABT1HWK2_STRSD|nr:leucine-zipper of insertion element IS481 [Streptoalloteichus tenebrarius]BFF03208.1 hypothetical protein GCM10020241_48830 [Streptoalloteichus tenebrarius]
MDRDVDTDQRKPLVTHAHTPLTPLGRLRLARCVVDEGWPLRLAAESKSGVSTAKRWADRCRVQGVSGVAV